MKYTTGSGAPTSTPENIGDTYRDTNAVPPVDYIADGIISSGDWKAISASVVAGNIALTTGSILIGAANVGAALDVKGNAKILVGNGTTATSVSVSGDITLTNAGVSAIGASKVVDSMIEIKKVNFQKINLGFAALNTAGTGVAVLLGTAIPDNAIIERVFIDVISTFIGDGNDSSTLKIGLEDQDNDVVAAIAISDGSNPWDAGLHEGIQTGTMANALKLSAARQLAVTWTAIATDTALTAGSMDVFVEWIQGA